MNCYYQQILQELNEVQVITAKLVVGLMLITIWELPNPLLTLTILRPELL